MTGGVDLGAPVRESGRQGVAGGARVTVAVWNGGRDVVVSGGMCTDSVSALQSRQVQGCISPIYDALAELWGGIADVPQIDRPLWRGH